MTTHGITTWSRGLLPRYGPKRTENLHPHKHLFMIVHSSIMQNRQREETTQARHLIDGQTKGGNPPNGRLFGNKEGYLDLFYNLNLENMRLIENASHRGPCVVCLHLQEMPRIGKSKDTKCRLAVAWGGEG